MKQEDFEKINALVRQAQKDHVMCDLYKTKYEIIKEIFIQMFDYKCFVRIVPIFDYSDIHQMILNGEIYIDFKTARLLKDIEKEALERKNKGAEK